jgi:hypothetical protein
MSSARKKIANCGADRSVDVTHQAIGCIMTFLRIPE